MRKLLSAMVVVFSMGMTGSVCAQDLEKGVKALQAQDYATALKEFRFLAERGNAVAQNSLGVMYASGQGVRGDKEAVTWFRKAAEQGDAHAQFNLAGMYKSGQGVVQNDKEAFAWSRKAAEQGDTLAQNSIGFMYAEGKGVDQDNVYAHMWFNIAASNGGIFSLESRDEIAMKMTAADTSKAQELALECVKKEYKGC